MSESNMEAINAALAAARQAAASSVNAVPATTTQASTPAPVVATRPVSMREMVQESGMRPDAYLKVTAAGFNVGKDTKTFFEELPVEFRIGAAKPFYGLRYGNPAKYERSYDRQYNARSKKDWSACVAEAARLDPRCTGDYPAVDLLMVVTEDIKGKDGSVLLEKGKTLGWTSSVTNWGEWVAFIEPIYALQDAGIIVGDPMVRGKIVHAQKSKEGNTWGAVNFDCPLVAEDQAAEAA